MGVDFHYIKREGLPIGARPHWSYSGFHRFRTRLAKSIGIDLDTMEGFRGVDQNGDPCGQSWEPYAADPIVKILHHSDCDGELSPDACREIAPRLRELVNTWPDNDEDGETDYDKVHALRLADMMEQCAANGWDLEFC